MSTTPYSAPPGGDVPAKDNTLKIVLIVLGVLLLIVMLVCGGLITAGYFVAKNAAEDFANEFGGAIAGAMSAPYLEAPEAKKALGRVVTTEAVEGEYDENFEGSKVRVIGTNGSGVLVIDYDERGRRKATLLMDDGSIIDLPVPEYEQTVPPEAELSEEELSEEDALEGDTLEADALEAEQSEAESTEEPVDAP